LEPSNPFRPPHNDAINLRAIPQFVSRYAPRAVIDLGLVIVILRTLEYLASTNENHLFYLSNLALTIMLLTVAGSLTSTLSRSLRERTQAMALLRLRHDLAIRLSSCRNISEVTREMIEQLAPIVPEMDIEFYLYKSKQSWLMPAEGLADGERHEDSASKSPGS
jgi:hypothetical protein